MKNRALKISLLGLISLVSVGSALGQTRHQSGKNKLSVELKRLLTIKVQRYIINTIQLNLACGDLRPYSQPLVDDADITHWLSDQKTEEISHVSIANKVNRSHEPVLCNNNAQSTSINPLHDEQSMVNDWAHVWATSVMQSMEADYHKN